jgi:dCTP diphosphatase
MTSQQNPVNELQQQLIEFAKARNWEPYHSPKNLSMALSVEVAELLEHFQWMTEAQSFSLSPETHGRVKDEVADVLLYLLQICNQLKIDPIDAARMKLEKNAIKYPAP